MEGVCENLIHNEILEQEQYSHSNYLTKCAREQQKRQKIAGITHVNGNNNSSSYYGTYYRCYSTHL